VQYNSLMNRHNINCNYYGVAARNSTLVRSRLLCISAVMFFLAAAAPVALAEETEAGADGMGPEWIYLLAAFCLCVVLVCVIHVRLGRARRKAEKALVKARDELEKTIEERTSELRDTNERLSLEIVERSRIEKQIQHRLRLERAQSNVSRMFASPDEADINKVLRVLGEAVEANRAYVFEMRENCSLADNTYEWCAAGTKSRIDGLQNTDTSLCPWMHNALMQGEKVLIRDIEKLPPEAERDKEVLRRFGIRADIVVPICARDGQLRAFMGFCDTEKPRDWSEDDANVLVVVGRMMQNHYERQESLRLLRESEEKHRLLVENASDSIVVFQDDELKFMNAQCYESMGYTKEEYLAVPIFDHVHPEDREFAENDTIKRFAGEQCPDKYDIRLLTKQGDTVWVRITAVMFEWDGRPACLVFMSDITERKRTEERLKGSQKNLEEIISFLPDATFAVDGDRRVVAWNRAIEDMTGVKAEDMIGKGNYEYSVPIYGRNRPALIDLLFDDSEDLRNLYPDLHKDREIIQSDFYVPDFKGGTYMSVKVRPLHDSFGNLVGAIETVRDETEYKMALEAFRESEEKYRLLLENQTELVVKINSNGNFLFANQTYCDLFGKSDSELVGSHYLPLVHEDDREETIRAVKSLENPPHTCYVEQRALTKDGWRWFAWADKAVLDDKGDVESIIAVGRDITEQKEAESALQRRIAQTDLIASISTQFINIDVNQIDWAVNDALGRIGRIAGIDRSYVFLKREDGKSYKNSHEWCAEGVDSRKMRLGNIRMGAFPWAIQKIMKGEIVLIPKLEELPPEASMDRDNFKSQGIKSVIAVSVMSGGELVGFTGFDMMKSDKNWSRDIVSLLKIVANIFGNALDRKRVESALRLSRSQLSESERHYRQLMEQASDGIYLADIKGNIVHVNTRACEMLGYSRQELERMNIADLVDPQTLPDDPMQLDILLAGQAIIKERQLLCKDGSVLPVEISAKMMDKNRIQSFVRDITERKKLEAQIQQARKLESLGVLAGGIAHDFNSMLVSILSNAGLALLDMDHDSPARESVQQIETAAMLARQLTSHMLAYSGKGKFIVQPLDLSRVVGEMTSVFKSTLLENLTLECEFGKRLPLVEGDTMQIRQLVMNLLTNASEATKEGGGAIKVRTGVMDADAEYISGTLLVDDLPEDRYVFVEVSDTGCGMDENVQAKIFDPFFSTKEPGRGLGLAGALGIVRGHRGAVKVESHVGLGTTIRVLLPVSETTRQELEPATPVSKIMSVKGGTVLVIDDDSAVRNVAEKILIKHGFKVLLASRGMEGVELFKARQDEISVVLLDMSMPEIYGEDVARLIYDIRSDVRIVFSSAYTEQYFKKSFTKEQLVTFLQKPYRPQELIDKIQKAMGA